LRSTTSSSSESTTTPSTAPTTSPTVEADWRCTTLVSSPAQFDPQRGQYAVYLTALSAEHRTVGFDVIQFLGGEDAKRAYHRDVPDDPDGPPNDYSIVNDSAAVRQAPVGSDVTVRLVRLHDDGSADLNPGTFDELPTYLSGYRPPDGKRLSTNPFWLSMDGGVVTAICEQYVP
jgi:hypothetical protein